MKHILQRVLTLRAFHLSCAVLFCTILFTPFNYCKAQEKTEVPKEYLMKAVCLYNFSQFTHWPGTKNLEKHETILLGVVGDSPFGDAIQELQASLTRKNKRNITVTYYGPYIEGMELNKNHILFISSLEQKNMQKIITSLKKAPVLTISDTDGFLEAGGMISLVLMNNNVRWGINRSALDMSGISVRAKLLQLAIKIIGSMDQSELFPNPFDNETPWQVSRTFFINICSKAQNLSARIIGPIFG